MRDDGVGFPKEFDYAGSPSLGLKLAHALVKQIGGRLQIREGNGVMFEITFHIPEEGHEKDASRLRRIIDTRCAHLSRN